MNSRSTVKNVFQTRFFTIDREFIRGPNTEVNFDNVGGLNLRHWFSDQLYLAQRRSQAGQGGIFGFGEIISTIMAFMYTSLFATFDCVTGMEFNIF